MATCCRCPPFTCCPAALLAAPPIAPAGDSPSTVTWCRFPPPDNHGINSWILNCTLPQELATVAFSLAKLHHRPSTEWLVAFEGACFGSGGGDAGAAASPDGIVGGPGSSSSSGLGGGGGSSSGDDHGIGLGAASAFAPDNLVTLLWSMVELGHGTWWCQVAGLIYAPPLILHFQMQVVTYLVGTLGRETGEAREQLQPPFPNPRYLYPSTLPPPPPRPRLRLPGFSPLGAQPRPCLPA